jgi:hypothetical protein
MSGLNRLWTGFVLAGLLGLSLLVAGTAVAQTAHYPNGKPQLPKWSSLPDWSGLWERDGDNIWDNRIPVGLPQDPSYNEQYKKLATEGPPGVRGSAFNSMPGYMNMLRPMDFQISRSQITITSEGKEPRRIYTDGRASTEDTLPSTTGYSVGQWVKGELIVKTCCIREDTRLPGGGPGGGPHSDAMEIEERFYLRNYKTLVDEITVKDPKAFTKPWSTEKVWYRRPDWESVEYDRAENDREANGTTTVPPPNTPPNNGR